MVALAGRLQITSVGFEDLFGVLVDRRCDRLERGVLDPGRQRGEHARRALGGDAGVRD